MKLKPRNFEKDYLKEFLITNHNPADASSNTFNEDGVFSERIFGKLSNGVDFSCRCGTIEGEFNLGILCSKCNTKVTYKGLNLSREGWIDLHYPIVNPLFYRYIRKIIGKTNLDKILAFKSKLDLNGNMITNPIIYPYDGIGMINFIDHFQEVLDAFFLKKKKKLPNDYNFIMENQELLFIEKFPVISSKLRPALMINNDLDYHEINNFYNGLIKNANTLKDLTELEETEINVNSLLNKNQELVNSVSDALVDELITKDGYIRNSLFGSRLNFSSRLVITPLSGEYSMNELVLPYVAGMELLKPLIVRKIRLLKKVNIFKASQIWQQGLLKFDKFLHKIMSDIIKSSNVGVLLNRNPTINLGSILFLKIGAIKEDYNDLTSSISNLLLTLLGADYDGDVLNHVVVFGEEFNELFKPFRPSQLIINPNTGEFNTNFLPFKDVSLGLFSLLN